MSKGKEKYSRPLDKFLFFQVSIFRLKSIYFVRKFQNQVAAISLQEYNVYLPIGLVLQRAEMFMQGENFKCSSMELYGNVDIYAGIIKLGSDRHILRSVSNTNERKRNNNELWRRSGRHIGVMGAENRQLQPKEK